MDSPTPEMQAFIRAATPGPEHALLSYMLGTWDVAVKYWPAPGAPPLESMGTSTAEWMLGGRFTNYVFRCQMMGQPFEGHGFTGFNNVSRKYFSIWADNMSTGVLHDTGVYDAAARRFTFSGDHTKPTGVTVRARNVIQIVDDDHHVITFHETPPGGPEITLMELRYSRKKT